MFFIYNRLLQKLDSQKRAQNEICAYCNTGFSCKQPDIQYINNSKLKQNKTRQNKKHYNYIFIYHLRNTFWLVSTAVFSAQTH